MSALFAFFDAVSQAFRSFLGAANDFLYSFILIFLLVIAGLYFTVRTRFAQFRLLPDAIRSMTERREKGTVSSFQALMISTASRVGTGNIAGVATAIALGGAGAVFWMWVMALLGAASAFAESTLAQIYKVRRDGEYRGGPAYYIQKALGKRWLGVLFAVLLIACFAFGFNGLQSYTITSAFAPYFGASLAPYAPAIIGLVLAAGTALVIFGGTQRIGFITSFIVPVMAIIYMALGFVIIGLNIQKLPQVLSLILSRAFDLRAIAGGFAGSAIVIGIKRGLFSNEAGMGSAPNAAATAQVSHPVKQGTVQVLSVFIDTLLICTTTAFILLFSGVQGSESLNALPFVQAAVGSQVGQWGVGFIAFSVLAFAFSSIVGNYCYAEGNLLFIRDNKALLTAFRWVAVAAVFFGAQADFATVWDLADVLMGLMAIVNIVSLFALSKTVSLAERDYTRQKREGKGKDPVFRPAQIGITGTDCWEDGTQQ